MQWCFVSQPLFPCAVVNAGSLLIWAPWHICLISKSCYLCPLLSASLKIICDYLPGRVYTRKDCISLLAEDYSDPAETCRRLSLEGAKEGNQCRAAENLQTCAQFAVREQFTDSIYARVPELNTGRCFYCLLNMGQTLWKLQCHNRIACIGCRVVTPSCQKEGQSHNGPSHLKTSYTSNQLLEPTTVFRSREHFFGLLEYRIQYGCFVLSMPLRWKLLV